MSSEKTVTAFNHDVVANRGYLYTTNARLSSTLANARLTDAALAATSFRDKRVIDVGCGDGTYTVELFDRGAPSSIHGIDYAKESIDLARSAVGARNITYEVCSAEALPIADDSFDVAHLRGVLHHLENPVAALREALRVAKQVVVIEPNGYNPVLKVIERVSRYHVEHREQSFAPMKLRRWTKELNGTVREGAFYAGLVPFFCPDPMARVLKWMEPAIERVPLVRELSCAVFVFVVDRVA
jgi:ubiquinone/menaquinone biosynthesis C-methylase UbiE